MQKNSEMEDLKSIQKKTNELLMKIKILDDYEKFSGLPRITVVIALVSILSLFLLFNYAGALISNFLGWVYPGIFKITIHSFQIL